MTIDFLLSKIQINEHLILIYLLLHHLGAENHHLGSRVLDLKLPDDRGSVVCDKELLEVVDDHLLNVRNIVD